MSVLKKLVSLLRLKFTVYDGYRWRQFRRSLERFKNVPRGTLESVLMKLLCLLWLKFTVLEGSWWCQFRRSLERFKMFHVEHWRQFWRNYWVFLDWNLLSMRVAGDISLEDLWSDLRMFHVEHWCLFYRNKWVYFDWNLLIMRGSGDISLDDF